MIFFTIQCILLSSQNLILNPGFEKSYFYTDLSEEEKMHYSIGWFFEIPNSWEVLKGTIDYYSDSTNEDFKKNFKTGLNSFGEIYPYSGSKCMGFLIGNEILGGELASNLVKDSIYKISFFMNFNVHASKGIRNLNFTFTNNKIKENLNDFLRPNVIVIDLKELESNTSRIKIGRKNSKRGKWVQVTGYYKAKGGEKYFYMGVQKQLSGYTSRIFGARKPSEKYLKKRDFKGYYYFDDVCVTLANNPDCSEFNFQEDSIITVQSTQDIELKKFTLDKLESNTFSLKPESKKKLNLIIPELLHYCENDSILIYINGHTDSIGSNIFNLTLSQNRANEVKEYLISNGICRMKIIGNGFGSTKPLYSNNTELNRQKNRRVEIIIVKVSAKDSN